MENKETHFKNALPGYYTAQEASQVLGYSDNSYISRLCRENRIKAFKLGTYWLIPSEQVTILESKRKEESRITRGQPLYKK